MKYLILIAFFISSITYAEDVKYIKQGEVAPFSGYLFSVDKEKEIRLMDQDYNFLKKENNILNNINKTYESNEIILNNRIDNQMKEIERLQKVSNNNDFVKIGAFILGALITGGIAYGVVRVTK